LRHIQTPYDAFTSSKQQIDASTHFAGSFTVKVGGETMDDGGAMQRGGVPVQPAPGDHERVLAESVGGGDVLAVQRDDTTATREHRVRAAIAAADLRDLAASRRDCAARARDQAARTRDAVAKAHRESGADHDAQGDRRAAVHDRQAASADRHFAALDRDEAAGDRALLITDD
jgi:hypothetical protein